MAMERDARLALVVATGLILLAVVPAIRAAGIAQELLAQGACSAAATAAAQAQTTAHGDAALADALALSTQVALECDQPRNPLLDDWLAQELRLRTRLDGADSAAVANVKLAQARLLHQRNQLDKALSATQALDADSERLHWPDAVRARIADELASILNRQSEASTALAASDRAIALARAAHADVALISALNNRTIALTSLRRGADAVAPAKEAVDLARARSGSSRELATTLANAAGAQRDAGDLGGAISSLEESLAIERRQAEPDQGAIADALLRTGEVLQAVGDLDGAEKMYADALVADQLHPHPSGKTRATIMHSMALLEKSRGHYQRAIDYYKKTLALVAQAFGPHSQQYAITLSNYAGVESLLHHYDTARSLYQRAIDNARARHSTNPGDYSPLGGLALIEVWQGNFERAERLFRERLQYLGDVGSGSVSSPLYTYMGLAASLWGQRRWDEAFDAALTAENIRQQALRLAASHLGERESVNLENHLRPSLDLVIEIAIASRKSSQLERAWQSSMAARDLITSILAQRLAASRADPERATQWRNWRAASAALARTRLVHANEAEQLEAQARLDRASRDLALGESLDTVFQAHPIAFASLRQHLPDDTSLLLFVSSRITKPTQFASDAIRNNSPHLYGFVLPSSHAPVRVAALGSQDEIDNEIEGWAATLADRNVALTNVTEHGRALSRRLWQPLTAAGAGKHWLVLPLADLYRLPWSALPDGDGYLADRDFRAQVLDHERELLAPAAPSSEPRLLAVVDPALDPGSSNLPNCARSLPALPGARRESATLNALWHKRFGGKASATVLSGTNATEARLRGDIATADIVHFGTHAINLDENCAATDTMLASTRGFHFSADTTLDTSKPAITPAALLFAPGPAAGSDNDGLLSAEEITALDLSRTRWAVLAACATAAGETHRYEGQFGLARAFRMAGARTVFTSLWPVDDTATAQWMQALYTARIERGMDTATSVAQAQREVLAARRARGESTHPYYWAAFVASGDWR
jgi:CHAT domain-containing protein